MNNYDKCGRKTCMANFSGDCRQPYLRCEARLHNSELRKAYMLRIKEHDPKQFLKEYDHKEY